MKKIILLVFCFISLTCNANERLRLTDLLEQQPQLDLSIPAPNSVMSLEVGERHWYHHEILKYMDALAEASPRMVALGPHAHSYGGRALVSYAISSPKNIQRLEEIRKARASLIDPSGNPDLSNQPAIVHMGYSIHGNEPSGANSTPLVAYYFNAAMNSDLLEQLENVVIIFNPMFNPDGLDRFANWSNSHRGLVPNSDPNDREHVEAFPRGRTNYYWFDLNRDWLPHQHPESQGRLRLFHEWKPNVQLDFHEQGSNNSFFFMPGKPERTNPLTPDINQRLTDEIAQYHRRSFDQRGALYFSGEGYDDFFIGKGSTYPDLFGCVGILFEQPSARGMRQDTDNGLLNFKQAISNQFHASLSSLEATAALRMELLQYQRDFYVSNARKDKNRSGYYLATAEGDPTRLREFVRILEGHQIKVEVLATGISVEGKTSPANLSIAVPAAQMQSTFLRSLWNRQTEFKENVFYDVSTWTLPLAFNLQHTREPVKRVSTSPMTASFLLSDNTDWTQSEIGYLVDWRDSASPALLYELLAADANVRVARRPLTAKIEPGREMRFGYGTLLVTKGLDKAIPENVLQLLKQTKAPVYPAASSATQTGIDLGSRDWKVLKKPKVLIATGPGIRAYGVGEIWHLLDQRVKMPLTMVDTHRLSALDLRKYTHVLLTESQGLLNEKGIRNLKNFVNDGGVLWAQGQSAVKWVVEKDLASAEWRKTEEERAYEARKKLKDKDKKNEKDNKDLPKLPERQAFIDSRDLAAFKLVRGAIFNTSLDVTHPIGYGYTSDELPVFRQNAKFIDRSENPYSTPLLYTQAPLLSGYISPENLKLISGSASIVIDQKGKGAVVLVLDKPTFRAFWWGTQRLLINAIFFGELLEEPK
jgi:hypothetical protein